MVVSHLPRTPPLLTFNQRCSIVGTLMAQGVEFPIVLHQQHLPPAQLHFPHPGEELCSVRGQARSQSRPPISTSSQGPVFGTARAAEAKRLHPGCQEPQSTSDGSFKPTPHVWPLPCPPPQAPPPPSQPSTHWPFSRSLTWQTVASTQSWGLG